MATQNPGVNPTQLVVNRKEFQHSPWDKIQLKKARKEFRADGGHKEKLTTIIKTEGRIDQNLN